MRKGPHPLSVQIGLAASSQGPGGGFALRPEGDASEGLQKMLLGIQKYQDHPFRAERLPLDILWQAGTVTINAIPGHVAKAGEPVLLLVPSMVNRAYILDLMPGRSMLRWLAGQGIAAYLLDWGEGLEDPRQAEAGGIVLDRLVPAIVALAQKTGRPVHVLGYCMGGTLLAGAAQAAAKDIASLIFLAAPWDFHAGTQNMLNRVKFWWPTAFPAIAEKGHLPKDWMQVLFASLAPENAAKKFAAFLEMDPGSDEAKLFVAVEDWLNDGVDLPGPAASACIRDWFMQNAPAAKTWMLRNITVDAAAIAAPALVIASDRDRLVDYDCAAALAAAILDAKLLNPGCGHIGMIAAAGAVTDVWGPIAKWVKNPSVR